MVGSCQFMNNQSTNVSSFKEISISTGKEHGAFYKPISEWIKPVKMWLGDKVQQQAAKFDEVQLAFSFVAYFNQQYFSC